MSFPLTFEVDFDQEVHCDECLEVEHFHIDECPICHVVNAGTDQYCSVHECLDNEDGIFKCEECSSQFQILVYDYCREPKEAVIKLISLLH